MNFPDVSFAGRERIRVCGRGLIRTNSAEVEFTSLAEREGFPLVLSPVRSPFLPLQQSWLIPIEADGYVLLSSGSCYNFLEVAPYRQFNYSPDCSRVVSSTLNFISDTDVQTTVVVNSVDCVSEIILLLAYPQSDGVQNPVFRIDNPLPVSDYLDALRARGIYPGAVFLGPEGYPTFTLVS